MSPSIFVRYCMSGHEVRFSELCPSECPICGDRIDRAKAAIPLEEVAQKKEPPSTQPKAELTPPTQPETELTPPTPIPQRMVSPVPQAVQASHSRKPIPQRMPLDADKQQQLDSTAEFGLSYFGIRISIPPEGGWLGREGLGSDCFEGNRYISRKHVFVKADQNGRLIVQDDQSLNGVYYDKGTGRQKLQKDSTIILNQGELLWLHNIPLKWERMTNG